MEYGKVDPDAITIGPRHRALDKSKVAALAESIARLGLQTPLSIYAPDHTVCELVAGHHRLAACRQLGVELIPCVFVDMDDIDRELWEIDENLVRANLTPAQEAEHLKRRKELWEARKESGKNFSTSDPRQGFAKDAADKTGRTKQSVNQSISRAEKIDPCVLGEITESGEEWAQNIKGVDLDAIKGLEPEQQRQCVEVVKSGHAKNLREASGLFQAEPDTDSEVADKHYRSLMSAWNKACPEARTRFFEAVDTPVFDQTRCA